MTFLLPGCSKPTDGDIQETATITDNNTPDLQTGDNPVFIGKDSCSSCHQDAALQFYSSHHDLAMQQADKDTVLGDFNDATYQYNDITSTFYQRDGKYYVNTDGSRGEPENFEIKYTFGITPLQQYLVEMPGGRLQALSIAWDTRPQADGGQQWFHLYPGEFIDYKDELHWTGINQNWNYMCAECHSTGLEKNYDPDSNIYNTSWFEIDVSCEACHGPGSRHAELARQLPAAELEQHPAKGLVVDFEGAMTGTWKFPADAPIALLDKPRNTDSLINICGRCHSRRTTIDVKQAYVYKLEDTHKISLLDQDLYFPDGQVDAEVYVYGSFLQSRMYQAGVSCNDCHDPHSTRLRLEGNGLCLQCHKNEVYNSTSHHFHSTGTAAAECVNCHMQAKTFMVIDERRDHSFRIPRPDLTIKTGSPNACSQCHDDKSPQWAVSAIRNWYGKESFAFHYGEAIASARRGDADAGKLLADVAGDRQQPYIARATAMELLGGYLNQENLQTVVDGLMSERAMLRSASVNALSALPVTDRFHLVQGLLDDPAKSVRIEVARLLAPMHGQNLPQQQRRLLDNAVQEYVTAQMVNSDRAFSHTNLGNLYAGMQRHAQAEGAYNKAIVLENNFIPAHINLADLYRLMNRDDQAESVLRSALEMHSGSAILHHALGLVLVRMKKYSEALGYLETAVRLDPDDIRFIIVYAIALNSQGRTADALAVVSAAQNKFPGNRDLILSLITLHRDSGDLVAALAYAERLLLLTSGLDQQAKRLVDLIRNEMAAGNQ